MYQTSNHHRPVGSRFNVVVWYDSVAGEILFTPSKGWATYEEVETH